jgi:hypothetical protein
MLVKALSPKIKKPKLLRSNPFRKSAILNGDDVGFLIDDEDLYVGYSRPNVVRKQYIHDDDLDEYILARLQLARNRALEAYKKAATRGFLFDTKLPICYYKRTSYQL